jgi:hypothetical protein
MTNEICSKDSTECCGGKGENCAEKLAAEAQTAEISLKDAVLSLQNTVITLQSQLTHVGQVVNNLSTYAQKIDNAAGQRIMNLEKHLGLAQETVSAESNGAAQG